MQRLSNRTLSENSRKLVSDNVLETTYEFKERGEDEYYYYTQVSSSQIVNEERRPAYDEESKSATVNFCVDDRDDSEKLNVASQKNSDEITTPRTTKKSTHFKQQYLSPRQDDAPPTLTACNNSSDISNNRDDRVSHQGDYTLAQGHYRSVILPIDVNYEYLDEEEIRRNEVRTANIYNLDGSEVKKNILEQTTRRMNVESFRHGGDTSSASPPRQQRQLDGPKARSVRIEKDENIDYSSRNFHDAKAAISAAAQRNANAPSNLSTRSMLDVQMPILKSGVHSTEHEQSLRFTDTNAMRRSTSELASAADFERQQQQPGVRVRRVGDTTIVMQHCDPYSLYWQLDQARRRDLSPPRRRFMPSTVIDEVSVCEEDEAMGEGEPEEDEPPPVEKIVLSPVSNDSGVNMESYYAKPFREPLPDGWERHKDPSGYSYYWHVDSGLIQRNLPAPTRRKPSPPPRTLDTAPTPTVIPNAAAPVSVPPPPPPQPPSSLVIEEHAYRQTTTKQRVKNSRSADELHSDCSRDDTGSVPTHMRFAVRSLGGTRLADEDLCDAERSSCTVNAALSCLSRADNDDIVRPMRWANGAPMFLDFNDDILTLRDARTLDALERTRVQNIRVWGVSKENPHDFAYVTRDPRTRNFFCHVFRCDKAPAFDVANTLRDICARIIDQRHTRPQRPATLNVGEFDKASGTLKRVTQVLISCQTDVGRIAAVNADRRAKAYHSLLFYWNHTATGIDTLNEAVDRLVREMGADRWLLADVSVAPSTILIHEATPTAPLHGSLTRTRPPIAECRVRFLSFLGIGRDIKHCAFIMHDACIDTFLCYVFRVDPNAALMAKTIEAACKLRYQKVLDAHLGRAHAGTTSPSGPPITTTTTYSH